MSDYELDSDTILADQQRLEALISEAAQIDRRLGEARSLFFNAAEPPATKAGWKRIAWQADQHLRVDHAQDTMRLSVIEEDMLLIRSRREAAVAAGWARHGVY